MRALLVSFIAALGLGGSFTTSGQEATSPPADAPTPTTAEFQSSAPPGQTNARPASIFSAETLRGLGVSPQARVVSVMTNRLDLIETRRARVEGGLVPVLQRPTLVTFLQLFNPFAPAEYGGTGPGTPDQAFSRAFADPIKTGPASPLISVGDRPAKSVSKRLTGEAY